MSRSWRSSLVSLLSILFLAIGPVHSRALPQQSPLPHPYALLPSKTWPLGTTVTITWNPLYPLYISSLSIDAYLCHAPTAPSNCLSLCQSIPTENGQCQYSLPSDLTIMEGGYYLVVTPRSLTPAGVLRTGVPGKGPVVELMPAESQTDDSPREGDDNTDSTDGSNGGNGDGDDAEDSGPFAPENTSSSFIMSSTCISVTLFTGVSAGIVVVMGILWLISILYLQRQLRLWIAAAIAAAAATGSGGHSGSGGYNGAAVAAFFANKTSSSGGRTSNGYNPAYNHHPSLPPSSLSNPPFPPQNPSRGKTEQRPSILRSSLSYRSRDGTNSWSDSSIVVTDEEGSEDVGDRERWRRSKDDTIFV